MMGTAGNILYTGVCHSDTSYLQGLLPGRKPVILGHEGAGIIESVGEGVTEFQVGDHAIPLFVPQCNKCKSCKSRKTNLCEEYRGQNYVSGVLSDGTSRFTCKGQTVYHMLNCSTFSQYTVLPENSVCKIDAAAPFDKVCLLGCGVATGYGAALNTAKLYRGGQFYWWRKSVFPEKTTDLPQVTDKLSSP